MEKIECNTKVYSFKERSPRLPVELRGKVLQVAWRGYLSTAAIKEGQLQNRRAQLVEIPAQRGYVNGVWFRIRSGVRGVLLHNKEGHQEVYMLLMPSSHYYRTMTGSERMPVLIKQVI